VVLRDHHGDFIVGACRFFPAVSDPEGAELRACRLALSVAKDAGARKLTLESVKAWYLNWDPWSWIDRYTDQWWKKSSFCSLNLKKPRSGLYVVRLIGSRIARQKRAAGIKCVIPGWVFLHSLL
jgi:hypothetical protein